MPPRWFAWLIGVFWVTMTGWLFWRDLWPSWRPGEPPPFHIDDTDEVLRKGGLQQIMWTVLRQRGHDAPVPVFNAVTRMEYKKETEIYTLKAVLTPFSQSSSSAAVVNGLKIQNMTSSYSIDRDGHLRSLDADVEAKLHFEGLKEELFSFLRPLIQAPAHQGQESPLSGKSVKLHISGEVRGQQFFGHCRASADYLSKSIDLDLPPTAVSHTGSVLMPLHPVNQISRLQLDQRWHQPLVDPLRDALPGLSNNVRSLNAHVLPQPQMLEGNDGNTTCLVIEYSNDENEILARTWVEQSSKRVLQQETILEDGRWIMKRGRMTPLSAKERPR